MLPLTIFALVCLVSGTFGRKSSSSGRSSSSVDCSLLTLDGETSFDIILPEDIDYNTLREENFAWTLGTDTERDENLSPDAIVLPVTDTDIQQIITFAEECDYILAPRSGGHQISGLSSCATNLDENCMQIDMNNFKQLQFNYENENDPTEITSVTVGVAWTIGELGPYLIANGVTFPYGICSNVGLGGHFQSSAYGYIGRSFGLGMDFVTSFKIAKADGNIETVTRDSNPDLYYAVLGGNPGSWGIVIEYTLSVIKDSNYPNSFAFQYLLPYTKDLFTLTASRYIELLNKDLYANYRDLTIFYVTVPLAPEGLDQIIDVISINGIWTGIDNGDIFTSGSYDELLAPLLVGLPPSVILVQSEFPASLSLAQWGLLSDNPTGHLVDKNDPSAFFRLSNFKYYTNSNFATEQFDQQYLLNIIDTIDTIQSNPNLRLFYQLYPGGGQVPQNTDTGNSFPWRDWLAAGDHWIFFENDTYASEAEQSLTTLRDANSDFWMRQGQGNGIRFFWATYNDIGVDYDINNDWIYYYPSEEHYKNLINIKKSVDPKNIFKNQLTIPTKFSDSNSNSDSTSESSTKKGRKKKRRNSNNSINNINGSVFKIGITIGILFVLLCVFSVSYYIYKKQKFRANLEMIKLESEKNEKIEVQES